MQFFISREFLSGEKAKSLLKNGKKKLGFFFETLSEREYLKKGVFYEKKD